MHLITLMINNRKPNTLLKFSIHYKCYRADIITIITELTSLSWLQSWHHYYGYKADSITNSCRSNNIKHCQNYWQKQKA